MKTFLFFLIASTTWAVAENWPSYRGHKASGLSAVSGPVIWDVGAGKNIKWSAAIPGLGLSSPVIWGDHVFLTTAVADAGDAELKVGLYGDIASADDNGPQSWRVICLNKNTGKILWEKEVLQGLPKVKRHTKSSHANCTAATDGKHLVAFFGSEGLYCLDFKGEILWSKSLGVLDSGYFRMPSAQWGFASSPIIHGNRVLVQCDIQKQSFLTSLDIATGNEVWRTPRNEVPTWSTPAILEQPGKPTQIVVNGFKHMGAYDFLTGKEVWKLKGGGDIPVPTPVFAHGLTFITNAHGRMSPIYAVPLHAKGVVDPQDSPESVAWWIKRGGNYMQTPIVVGDLLFACSDSGILTCFDAKTGTQHFKQRLRKGRRGFGFTASPVSDGSKLYYATEDGRIFIVAAEIPFRLLGDIPLGETSCMASPALADGVLYVRTRDELIAIQSGADS